MIESTFGEVLVFWVNNSYRTAVERWGVKLDRPTVELIRKIALCIDRVRRDRGMVYIVGNSDCMSQAMGFSADLGGITNRMLQSATVDPSVAFSTADFIRCEVIGVSPVALSASVNDYVPGEEFAQEVRCKLTSADLLIVLSGGGNSKNLRRAMVEAKKRDAMVIAIMGGGGGLVKELDKSLYHLGLFFGEPGPAPVNYLDYATFYAVGENAIMKIRHLISLCLIGYATGEMGKKS